MPLIHHPLLGVERDVSDDQAQTLTTNPRVPWVAGPLPKSKPTAAKPSPVGDITDPPLKED